MNREQVWLAMSFSWSEIGIEQDEYEAFAVKIGARPAELGSIRHAVFWEVCGAFAVFTALALFSMGAALPDWGFEDEYTIQKVSGWLQRPLLFSLLNPLWVVGYPLACLLALGGWLKLSKSIRRAAVMAQQTVQRDGPASGGSAR